MKAMVLAAGEGTRLYPLTYNFPKPLVPVVNRPVMEHILRWLFSYGIREVVINTHYRAEQIENYFGDGAALNIKIHYSREKTLWGTAGGVRQVMDQFHDTFLVIGGDDLSDVNLAKLIQFHKARKAIATIGLKEVKNPEQYGIVVTDAIGGIVRFQEKPSVKEALSSLANTGIYVFEPEIFNFIPEHEKFDFGRQVFPRLLERKAKFFGCPVEGYWCDVGTLEEYKESHWAILEGRCKVSIPEQTGVSIHPSAILDSCVLGQGTVVEAEAHLAHVVTGQGVLIRQGAQLDHVIAWDHSVIGERASLKDCVISQAMEVAPDSRFQHEVLVPPIQQEKDSLIQ